MPLDDETAARFDHMMLPLAQQVAAMAQGENAIDMMLDLYFSFLRRKTDFFSQGEMCERAVQSAFERQRAIVAKSEEGKARAAAEKAEKEAAEREAARAREAAELERQAEEDEKRRARVKQAELERKMAEQAKAADGSDKIQEITDEEAEKIKSGGDDDDVSHDLTADEDDQDKLAPGTMMPNSGNGGEAEHYVWHQTLTDVDVRVRIPVGTPAKQIVCDFKKSKWVFGLKGETPMIEGDLYADVQIDDCFWTMEDKTTVLVTFQKKNDMEWWDCVVRGHPCIDTKKVTPENSKLSDLDGETRATVEKMMFDQQQKMQGKPTSDEMKKQDMMKQFMDAHPEMDFSQCKFS